MRPEFSLGQGWLYLVAVLDLYSRRVIGWAMRPILDNPLALSALRMVLAQRRPDKNSSSTPITAASSPAPPTASSLLNAG